MNIASDLNSFCDWLHTQVNAPVMMGRPDEGVRGLFVWPWRIVPQSHAPNFPPGEQSARPEVFEIHFLVLAQPALSTEGLGKLEAAQRAIAEYPVIEAGERQLRILADTSLATSDLAQLFLAAQLPLTLCLPCVLQTTSNTQT